MEHQIMAARRKQAGERPADIFLGTVDEDDMTRSGGIHLRYSSPDGS
jgi:hypothetical protein